MTNDEIKKLNAFLATQTNGAPEVQFRLYYSGSGIPLFYTTDILPGNYITITKQEFLEARMDITVSGGKIVTTQQPAMISKLVQNLSEGVGTSKYDINIITDVDPVFWKYEHQQRNEKP